MKNTWQKILLLSVSHLAMLMTGFAAGIYSLPILMAPSDPSSGALVLSIKNTRYVATIADELEDSDWLHWGEGRFSVADDVIVFQGKLAPGPAYQMYLASEFVESEGHFLELKQRVSNQQTSNQQTSNQQASQKPASLVAVGEVNSFNNHIIALDPSVDIEEFNTIIIWCEAFNQFITSAQYKL
jgi:hypothetical protein